jgi:hypothetical protein
MQPPELLALLRSEKKPVSQADYEAEKSKHAGELNFILIIEDDADSDNRVKTNVYNDNLYREFLAYANTSLANDFYLLVGKESIRCSMVHLEPANSIRPVIRIGISFSQVSLNGNECTLVFDDNLFNNGKLKFNYSEETVTTMPQFKI